MQHQFVHTSVVPKPLLRRFIQYLRLERSFSENTLAAYIKDVDKLFNYLECEGLDFRTVTVENLEHFVATLMDIGIQPRSISRVLSGVKSFYRFLELEQEIDADPTELLDSPARGQHLPDVMTIGEIDMLIDSIDLTKPEGYRDRAILETLYSCGLRVSELCHLNMQDLFLNEGFIRVRGKGRKERLVPISQRAIDEITRWFEDRALLDVKPENADYVFLSIRRRTPLSRITVFHIVKELCQRTGLRNTISPHTFRHSFATHLLEGGANLRAIQDMLGHEDIGTTEIYVHIDRHRLRDEIMFHHPRNIIAAESSGATETGL